MGTGNLGPKIHLVKNLLNFMTHSRQPSKSLAFAHDYITKTIKIQLKPSAFSWHTGKSLAYSRSKKECSAYLQIIFGCQLLHARFRDHSVSQTTPNQFPFSTHKQRQRSLVGLSNLDIVAISQRLRWYSRFRQYLLFSLLDQSKYYMLGMPHEGRRECPWKSRRKWGSKGRFRRLRCMIWEQWYELRS